MADYKQLAVWHRAHQFTIDIYNVTRSFPQSEMFGLVSQMRRSAVSIGSNLAEGKGRGGDSEFRRFIKIALGSASEIEYQLLVARDVQLVSTSDFERLNSEICEISCMLWALQQKVSVTSSAEN
jgi:four helix bundle protein